jgi:hypothetical protein
MEHFLGKEIGFFVGQNGSFLLIGPQESQQSLSENGLFLFQKKPIFPKESSSSPGNDRPIKEKTWAIVHFL